KTNKVCSHPKHQFYLSAARHGTKTKSIKKVPERLINFFELSQEAMMCRHCLYKTDDDSEYVNLPNYLLPIERISKEDIRKFQDRSYVLRSDIIYSQFQFQELEFAYYEVCAELDEAKLESIPFSKKIKLMAGVLYTRQRVYNERPILDPKEFKKMLEEAEPSLKGFFDQLVAGTNPQVKNHMTNEKNERRLVSFCYFLAGLNNKFINGIKAEVGLLLDRSGASSSAIETLAGAGLTIRRETIARQKARHAEAHTMTVGKFLVKNIRSLVVLNIDDFHNIHEYRRSDTTTTHEVSHFITILLKALPETASIPFYTSNQEGGVYNEKGIDENIIIPNAYISFFPYLWLSYVGRKQAFTDLTSLSETHDERVERLLIHSYDDRIEQRQVDRSMDNTKLVDLKEGSLRSTNNYVDAIKHLMDVPEVRTYVETQILVAPMDYPGQLHVRRAINYRIKVGDLSRILEQILHIVPMIGPLHVSLNSRETVFLENYTFFDKLFHAVFGHQKVLAKKPKPYKINLLLELASQGWSRMRLITLQKFEQSKDPEVRYLINLLDNIIPLVLDFYPIIFRSGNWMAYKEAIFRVWTIFFQYKRRHYNKLPLAFLSDVFYWASTNHPISQALVDFLHVFNDYYVENFHSSLRRQIQESNPAKQIIQQARIIDQMRGGNSFTSVFAENHNIRYSAKQLEYLEKRTALFLLNFFTGVYRNLGRSKVISSDVHSKPKIYELPTLEAQVDVKILAMAWNTAHPPREDRYCDLADCIYSYEVGSQCQYCTDYLVSEIETNCKNYQKTLTSFDKMITDEGRNESDITETVDNTIIREDFSLDDNIDIFFERA
ncbi:812_t:CDS:2, partial [Ambispora gerdemannii]